MTRRRSRNGSQKNRITSERRRKVVPKLLDRDGNACYYCREPFTDERVPTIDHIVPISEGGGNTQANMVLACDWCNEKRGTKTVDQYICWLIDHHIPAERRRKRALH